MRQIDVDIPFHCKSDQLYQAAATIAYELTQIPVELWKPYEKYCQIFSAFILFNTPLQFLS